MTARIRKAKTKSWTNKLDRDEVREALEQACIDAYDEDEQHTGLLTLVGDELQFPFEARVMGKAVQVVDMKWPEDDSYGLDLICEIDGDQHGIEARSVELLRPFPQGYQFLAAYLDWKRRL